MARLPNPAKTLAALPAGAQIELHQFDWVKDDGSPWYGYVDSRGERWVNADGTPWMGRRGTIEILIRAANGDEIAHLYAERYRSGYHVGESTAQHGWGPLAYDILMERATELGSSLGAGDASREARAVWQRYLDRPDVTATYEPLVAANLGELRGEDGNYATEEDVLRAFKAGNYMFRKEPKLLHELAAMRNVTYTGDWPRPARPRSTARLGNPGKSPMTRPRTLFGYLSDGGRVIYARLDAAELARYEQAFRSQRGSASYVIVTDHGKSRSAEEKHFKLLGGEWRETAGPPKKNVVPLWWARSTPRDSNPTPKVDPRRADQTGYQKVVEQGKLRDAFLRAQEQPLPWAAWEIKHQNRRHNVRSWSIQALRDGGYLVDGPARRVRGGDGVPGGWLTPVVLTAKGEKLASTWSASYSKALEAKWAKEKTAFEQSLKAGPPPKAKAPVGKSKASQARSTFDVTSTRSLASDQHDQVITAKRVAVHFTGTVESVSAVLWTLLQGRTDAVVSIDTKSKVLRSYGKALAKTYGLSVLPEGEIVKKWSKGSEWPLAGVVIVQGGTRDFVERREDAGPHRGAIGVGVRLLGYDLLDKAGLRPPPQCILEPTREIRDWSVERGLTDAQFVAAAKRLKGKTFEQALAMSTILSGSFPESLVLFDKGQKRETQG